MTFSTLMRMQGGEPFPATGTGAAAPVGGNIYVSDHAWNPYSEFTEWEVGIGIVPPAAGWTSGDFQCDFEIWVADTLPNTFQDQVTNGFWQAVDPTSDPDLFRSGGDWPVLATYSNGAMKITRRRLYTQEKHRVKITSTLAGTTIGAATGAPLSVVAFGRAA